MDIVFKLISLAQDLDGRGLIKEADALDQLVGRIVKNAHDDVDIELITQSLQKYIEEGLSLEEAMIKAVSDFEELQLEGESFSVSPEDRGKAKDYIPLQLSEMFSPIAD